MNDYLWVDIKDLELE